MATLVYAVFDDEAVAAAAIAQLSSNAADHPAFPVQVHGRGALDGDDLPESATEIGRNTIIATGAGGVAGLAIGLGAGAFLDVMGLTPAIGAMFGLITGVLSGLLGGMMAGTRRPKLALREAAEALEEHEQLVTVEVLDPAHVELVEDLLEAGGAVDVDRC